VASTVLLIALLSWFFLNTYPLGGQGSETIVQVTAGQSLGSIAQTLKNDGVISSTLVFRIDTTLFGSPTVRAGSYQVRKNSSFSSIKSILSNGPNVVALNVAPGLTVHEIALQLASDEGNTYADTFLRDATLDASSNPFHPDGSLEGLLGTGTYLLTTGETPQALLTRMQSRFVTQARSDGLTPTTTSNGLDAYQLVIAASIVEKEGYYPVNMPKVARVIINRLARGGDLQMDATILYYLGVDGGTVTHAMLETRTPYNTYLSPGLTPTPICQVGSVALRSMVNPPAGPWLYFTVIDKNGDEAFATTFAQQLANEHLAAERGVS